MYKVINPWGYTLHETESEKAAIAFAEEYALEHGYDIEVEDDNGELVYNTWLCIVEA